MGNALQLAKGGSAFSENASPARTDADRRRAHAKIFRVSPRRSYVTRKETRSTLPRSATRGYSSHVNGNSRNLIRVSAYGWVLKP